MPASGWDYLVSGLRPIPPDVRAAFEGTEFNCECGGIVVPQTMETGVCISCKDTVTLEDCEYSEDE